MTTAAQRLFARLTSPSFDVLAGVPPPSVAPSVDEADAAEQSISLATSSSSRLSLLDLPPELIEGILRMAWPEMGNNRLLAPCRDLQPIYDRLLYETIRTEVVRLPYWHDKLRRAPELLEHVREFRMLSYHTWRRPMARLSCYPARITPLYQQMRKLEVLRLVHAPYHDFEETLYSAENAGDPDFLPNLRELHLVFNPFQKSEPIRTDHLVALGKYPHLRRLALFDDTEDPSTDETASEYSDGSWSSVAEPLTHDEPPPPPEPVAISALALPSRLTSFTFTFAKEYRWTSDTPAWLLELFACMPRLANLDLGWILYAGDVINLLSALPEPSSLRHVRLSFNMRAFDDTSFRHLYANSPRHAERLCLAPVIRLLPALETVSIDESCSITDDASIEALRAHRPLRRITFARNAMDWTCDVLRTLKALGPALPQEVALEERFEHELLKTTTREYLRCRPVWPDDTFPDTLTVHGREGLPWRWSEELDGLAELVDFCEMNGVRLTGRMQERIRTTENWEREQADYKRLQEDHAARRGLWGEGGPLAVKPAGADCDELAQLLRQMSLGPPALA